MNRDDAEEFTQSLDQIATGTYRQILLAKRLGVPAALGLSTDQWVKRLGGYVRYEIDERRKIVHELTDEGLSQREIGEVLGVDHKTVHNDLHAGENSPEKPPIQAETGENSPESQPEPPNKAARERYEAEQVALNQRFTLFQNYADALHALKFFAFGDAIIERLIDAAHNFPEDFRRYHATANPSELGSIAGDFDAIQAGIDALNSILDAALIREKMDGKTRRAVKTA